MNLDILLLAGVVAGVAYISVQQVVKALREHSIQARSGVRRYELQRVLVSANRLQRCLDLVFDARASEVLAIREIRTSDIESGGPHVFCAEIVRLADLEFSVRELSGALGFCSVFLGENWFKMGQQAVEEVEKICRDFRRYHVDTSEEENENLKAAAVNYAIESETFPFSNFSAEATRFRAILSRLEDGLRSELALY